MSRFARLTLIAWTLAIVSSVWWAAFALSRWHLFIEGSSLVLGGLVPLAGTLSGLWASLVAPHKTSLKWSAAAAGINALLIAAFARFVFPDSVWEEMLREWCG